MPVLTKFILIISLILGGTAAGYLCRRTRILPERASQLIMTFIAVVGYPSVGFLSIWLISPRPSELLLPLLAMVQVLIMAGFGLLAGRAVTKDRSERGLFAVATAAGNWGFTMGGFVIYVLLGPEGLGRASIYTIMFTPALVLIMYPIARGFTSHTPQPLAKLMLRSIFDYRSLGLATAIAALVLSLAGVPCPSAVLRYRLLDVLMLLFTPLAYFAIGLRLHVSRVGTMKKMLAALAVMRFGVNLLLGLGIVYLMRFSPWPLIGLGRDVFLMQSVVPTAVSMVAVANMFDLRPREGSVLFVVNSLVYLIVALPALAWVYAR